MEFEYGKFLPTFSVSEIQSIDQRINTAEIRVQTEESSLEPVGGRVGLADLQIWLPSNCAHKVNTHCAIHWIVSSSVGNKLSR